MAQLLFLEAENPKKEISFYINSPGGVVTSGLSIYDTMQFIRCPVSTLCVGQAASMGLLLLTAGEKGMRFARPNARIMVHQPSGGYQGQVTDIMIHARESEALKRRLNGSTPAYRPALRGCRPRSGTRQLHDRRGGSGVRADRPGDREASRADRHPGLALKTWGQNSPGASFCRVTPFLLIARPPRDCMGIRERQRFGRSILSDGTFY